MSNSAPKTGTTRSTGRGNRRAKSAGPEKYDFRRPTKLAREHIRTLQVAYEAFARQYTTLLTSTLRAVSQVSLLSIEQVTYDDYIASLNNPTCMFMIEMEPLPGVTIFEFSLTTALAWVDHMLGGPGGKQPQRPLTDIEVPLVNSMLDRVFGELRGAFEHIVELSPPKIVGLEYNPQFAQTASMSDAMIVTSFELKVGSQECVATICMPFASIFPKLRPDAEGAELTDTQRQSRDAALRAMTAGLGTAPVEVSVRFNSVLMSPRDLVTLRPGDIVPLEHPVTTPLVVTSHGVTFAHAVAGSSGNRLACLVVPPPKED
ncbi:flagellar motor switch protein FliM [Virgisporangium aurantiacum]|uniref:Flagellar motor switch protein FliM n=1 Tax=Virgisporangium aurantiacum TaxID=175570 RepID=A0A8J4DVK9_9ACTN|nr:flagellar motor switch protein FliM [Virgisporangium aurantiacum]GIJ52525.1 flagellar motor switch protein FliM [Virgisporangium aurantiacum]